MSPQQLLSLVLESFLPQALLLGDGCGFGALLVSIWSNSEERFVSSELDYSGNDYAMLRARNGTVDRWETFRTIGDCWSSCLIQSVANRKLVSAELGYQGYAWGELRARADAAGIWERWRFEGGDCNSGCAIRSLGNDLFVSTERDYTGHGHAMLCARATEIQGWELYTIRSR